MNIHVKTTCNKCKSTTVSISWKYRKEDEMAMLMSHDGYGLQFDDAKIVCSKCGSDNLSNLSYNNKGKILQEEKDDGNMNIEGILKDCFKIINKTISKSRKDKYSPKNEETTQ